VRTRRGLARALASVSVLSTAVALAAGTLPSAASAAARGQSGPAARIALARVAASAVAPTHPGTAPGAATGAISGIVRGLGGAALPGACVTATGPAGSVTSLARSGGRYVLAGLLPGSYTVSYRDCAQPSTYFRQWYGNSYLAAGAAHVTVSAGRPATLAPVTLRATDPRAEVAATQRASRSRLARMSPAASGGVISGVAENRAGKRLPNICVQASSESNFSSTAWFTQTGPRGGYSLPVGTSGKWTVQFTGGCGNPGNYAPQWWRHTAAESKATKLTERPGRSFRGISAVLRPGAIVTGTVRSSTTGSGVGGVCVDATGLRGMRDVHVQARTHANGTYTMRNLGTGRFHLNFYGECDDKADYLDASRKAVAVTDGKTTSGINATLRPGAEIHGVVTGAADGKPVSGVCVDAENGGEDFTQADGRYSLTHLRAGSYTIGFLPGCGGASSGSYAPQYYANAANPLAATPVALSGGQTRTGIDVSLQPGGTVTGQVTSRSGAPLAGVCAWLTSRSEASGLGANPFLLSTVPIFAGEGGMVMTGPKGHFTARNLLPGQYSVLFAGGCEGRSMKYAPQLFAPQGGGQWISVGGGTVTTGVNAALQVGGSITGTVTARGGKTLSGICVQAIPTGVPAEQSFSPEPASRRNGSYQLSGLAPGRYAVEFAPCGNQPYAPQWYKGKSSQAAAAPVMVQAGQTTRRVSVTMVSGGTLVGHVRSGITGGPVRNACVLVTDASGFAVAGALTSTSGQYRIRHMPAGRWTLKPAMCLAASPSLAGIVRSGYRVRNARTTTANLTLPRGGSLSGTVQSGSPATAEAGICVEATPLTGHGQPNTAVTGADGSYTLPGMAPGSYRVLFTPLCVLGTAAVAPQWYNGASSRAAATPVKVTGGQTATGIGGTLAADGAISGTVTVSGTATAGVCVGAYAGTSAAPAAIAITGSGGSYQIAGLPAGSYSVEFTKGCGAASYAAQWYGGATRDAATPVTVTAGATATGIDAS
jgi:carboxypeptidase family protein